MTHSEGGYMPIGDPVLAEHETQMASSRIRATNLIGATKHLCDLGRCDRQRPVLHDRRPPVLLE